MEEKSNHDNAKKSSNEKYSMETRLIYGKSFSAKWDYRHHVTPPISSSTTFRLDSVERGAAGFMQFANTALEEKETPIFIYDRLGEPNKDLLEENIAQIEKGEMAVSFSSGMGAISAVLGILTASGDEIVTHHTLYGCTISLLNNWYPRYNIKNIQVDLTDTSNLEAVINENTKVVYLESPANPNLDIIDIEVVAEIVKKLNEERKAENRIHIVVDNTFATSYCQRPLELGADFVIHSLTKGMGGFGTDIGGIVIGRKEFRDKLLLFRKDFGAVLSPRSAWAILTYGLPTLPLRARQQINSATKIAEYLNSHPKIEFVNYPGLRDFAGYETAKKQMLDFDGNFAPGSLIYFGLKGGNTSDSKKKGAKFMDYIADNSYSMTLAVSLGHTRTLIEHPASMTHSVIPEEKLQEWGLHPGGVRLAIGIENPEDILHDLEAALSVI